MDNYFNTFERATKLSRREQKKVINWFNKQPLELQIDIFKEQKNQFFILKNSDFKEYLLSIISFYLAVTKFYNLDTYVSVKNKTMKLNKQPQKNYRVQKLKVKREKLLNIWSKIQSLKKEGYSFRDIEIHIKQRHRFNVSHTYIRKVWLEIEND